MLSEYDKRCIKDIQTKTGIGINKVEKYYIANGCDVEKTLKDIQNKINLGIIEVIGLETSSIIGNNVNSKGDKMVNDKDLSSTSTCIQLSSENEKNKCLNDKNSLIQIELTSNK